MENPDAGKTPLVSGSASEPSQQGALPVLHGSDGSSKIILPYPKLLCQQGIHLPGVLMRDLSLLNHLFQSRECHKILNFFNQGEGGRIGGMCNVHSPHLLATEGRSLFEWPCGSIDLLIHGYKAHTGDRFQ